MIPPLVFVVMSANARIASRSVPYMAKKVEVNNNSSNSMVPPSYGRPGRKKESANARLNGRTAHLEVENREEKKRGRKVGRLAEVANL